MTLYQNYIISLYSTALTVFLLALFVAFQKVKREIKIPYILYSLCVSIWGSGQALALEEARHNISLFFVRNYCHSGVIFIPIFFVHFILVLLEKAKEKKNFIYFCYIVGFIFLILNNFTPLIIRDVGSYPPIFGLVYIPGYLHPVMVTFFISLVVYGNYLLFKGYRKETGRKYLQLKWLSWITLLAYIGGAPNFLLGYRVQIKWLMPFGTYVLPIFAAGNAYAIVRHKLMEIEVVIKKTLVFASLFAIVFGIFIGITLVTQELIAGGRILGLAISSIIIIMAVRPLEDFLVSITDKFLFQKKYDYKHLIRQFMDELKTMVLNAGDIAQSTLDFLNSSIHPNSSAIFMHNRFKNKYDLIASVDFSDKNMKIPDNDEFINELRSSGEILNVNKSEYVSKQEKEKLSSWGIELLIPLLIHKELLGVLFLGKKKSDEQYSEEDIEVFSDLSGALSIAINNAQLFDERADAEKRAMIGTLATGINHEIGNPLNIISIKLQAFRLLAKQGLLDKKTKEEIINEVSSIAETCLESTQRISDITNKISQFAKPDKELVFDNINVTETIDDTLSILEHELSLERIKFEKNILCKSPVVIADRGQLKQVIFNLVKNAAHAINKEDGKIIIDVNKHGTGEIIIKVSDNGCGIPEKDIEKVFMPFYTTKEPGKGTGLGLALVSRLVERNNGKIKVESLEGKGTTFSVILKGKSDE